MLRNRDYWNHAKIQQQLAGLNALVSSISSGGPSGGSQGPSSRRGMRVAGRQSEVYDRANIRGIQMNLGVPSAAGFSLKWSLARRPRC